MIYSVLSALAYLRTHEIYHGAIQPKHIFIMRDSTYKIYNYRSLSSGLSSYKQITLELDSDIYLSPQLFANLYFKRIIPIDFDREKSEVFSLGMTALNMATLRDVAACYD